MLAEPVQQPGEHGVRAAAGLPRRAVTGTRSSAIQGDGKAFSSGLTWASEPGALPNQPLIITHWTGPEGTRLEETSL